MLTFEHLPILFIFSIVISLGAGAQLNAQQTPLAWMTNSQVKIVTELTAQFGEAQRPHLQQGLKQVASFWRAEDGDAAAFEEFVRRNFAGDQTTLDVMFTRFEYLLEQLNGHLTEISREFRQIFFKFCESQPNISVLIHSIGSWDFELVVDVEEARQITAITQDLYDNFGAQLNWCEMCSIG